MKKTLSILMAVSMLAFAVGCSETVPQGKRGRISTTNGWEKDILKPGRHTCYGHDNMYTLETTSQTFKEKLDILVGGKVNLRVDITVRVKSSEDDEQLRKAFETVTAKGHDISAEQLYTTFLQMKVLAIPRQLFEVQPDVQTAVANSPKIATEVAKRLMEEAKQTPLTIEDVQITNYDWPKSITEAQESLVKIQLLEAAAEAQVRADLKRSEGQLKIATADKLVELKKAEAVAESIDIIKKQLAGAPEYLMWHQIRVMGQAAMGPNNCFILYPYSTSADQVKQMVGNTNLSQMLKPDGPHPEMKKANAPVEQIKD